MLWPVIAILVLIWLALVWIGGAIDRLATHHEKFSADGIEAEHDAAPVVEIEMGQELWIVSMGQSRQCRVTAVAEDGAICVEPVEEPATD